MSTAATSPKRATKEAIKRLIDLNEYVAVRDIAKALDLSTQRIYQITKSLGLQQDETGRWIAAPSKSA